MENTLLWSKFKTLVHTSIMRSVVGPPRILPHGQKYAATYGVAFGNAPSRVAR